MFVVNVEGAVSREDKWLLITRSTKEKHAGGTLSLVGGKVDTQDNGLEAIERALKREMDEEVGIAIQDHVSFVYSSSFILADGRNVINLVFVCDYASGTAHAKSTDEVDDVQWLTYDEIMNHPLAPPWTKEHIRRAALVRRANG